MNELVIVHWKQWKDCVIYLKCIFYICLIENYGFFHSVLQKANNTAQTKKTISIFTWPQSVDVQNIYWLASMTAEIIVGFINFSVGGT